MHIYEFSLDDAIEWTEYNILGLNDGEESLFGVHYIDPEVGLKKTAKVRRKVRKVRRRKG
jgi:hypothetical protein